MARGKRSLIIEVDGTQFTRAELDKFLQEKLKKAGVKYSEDVKMYFNIREKIIYCVCSSGKNLEIKL